MFFFNSIISTINYTNKKINEKNNLVEILFRIIRLFLVITAMTIFLVKAVRKKYILHSAKYILDFIVPILITLLILYLLK